MQNLPFQMFIALTIGIASLSMAADVPISGSVLNQDNDDPIPGVTISLKSGKLLGKTSSKGKFDFMVDSEKSLIVVYKDGYEPQEIRVNEQPDALDMMITLAPNVKTLGSTQVYGERRILAKDRVDMDALESIQGMQFDLNEHLSKIPGVAGQSEFTKEISYYGSRTEDLAVSIGALRIPHMRHVDIGFPGNTSVLNPSVFKDVRIHSQNEGGSLDAGLAGRIEYTPRRGDSAAFAGSGRIGVINQEVILSGPIVGFDEFIISYRNLNPFVLEKMGENFFNASGAEGCNGSNCSQSAEGTDWKLNSGDFYGHFSSTDSSNNATRATFLYAWDDYQIDQTLSERGRSELGLDKIAAFQGKQQYTLFSWEGLGAEGFNYNLGYVKSENQKVFRDTVRVRSSDANEELLGDPHFIEERYTLGLSHVYNQKIAGARLTYGAEFQRWIDDRNDGFHTKVLDPQGNEVPMAPIAESDIIRLHTHFKWRQPQSTHTFQVGAWGNKELSQYGPQAIFNSTYKNLLPSQADLVSGLAFQSAPRHQVQDLTELELSKDQNLHANLGFIWLGKGHSIHAKVFGRYYIQPLGPIPEVFWMYRSRDNFYDAQVIGANVVYEWTASPDFALISNLSSTYGTYNDEIQWEANRLVDVSNSLRYYPRRDSLLSLIVTHKASVGAPTYYYDVYLYDANYQERFPDRAGTYSVKSGREIDIYRTDLRLHLDLSSKADWLSLRTLRFYTEVNNVLSGFNFPGSDYLGGKNTRQRGWTTGARDDIDQNRRTLTPYWSQGMGLFVQFGFEGNFGG